MSKKNNLKQFYLNSNRIRLNIIEMLFRAQSGHSGPSLSIVEILNYLFFQKKIYKDFKFKNHYEVMSVINLIAWISHREDHHPEITFSYNIARVTYYTYAIDGLSENDFICASKIDKAT